MHGLKILWRVLINLLLMLILHLDVRSEYNRCCTCTHIILLYCYIESFTLQFIVNYTFSQLDITKKTLIMQTNIYFQMCFLLYHLMHTGIENSCTSLFICSNKSSYVFKKLLAIVSLLVFSSENGTAPKRVKLWCAAMQMDFSLPCLKEGKAVTLPPFSPGSLLSRQPPVKTHDHHSFSLYHHNVPRPHRLTISYTLKFMTSSQCRNWFSMLWFPFRFWSIFWFFLFLMAVGIWCAEFLRSSITFDVMKSDLMVLKLHKADGPVYDNKQGNTEILYYLQNYYRSLFPL